jgi:hypothetical protein
VRAAPAARAPARPSLLLPPVLPAPWLLRVARLRLKAAERPRALQLPPQPKRAQRLFLSTASRCFLFGQVSALSRALARASCSPAVGAAPAPSAEAQAAGAASRGSWRAQPHAQSTCRSSALHRCDPYCDSAQPSVAPRDAVCLTRAPAPAGLPPEASGGGARLRYSARADLDPCWHTAAPTLPDTPAGGRSCRRCGNRARAREQPTKAETREKCPATKRKRSKNDVWRLLPLFVPVSAPCFALRAVA